MTKGQLLKEAAEKREALIKDVAGLKSILRAARETAAGRPIADGDLGERICIDNVIPAPRGPERPEREQAGTHATANLLFYRTIRPTAQHFPRCVLGEARACFEVNGSRPVPVCSLRSQTAPG